MATVSYDVRKAPGRAGCLESRPRSIHTAVEGQCVPHGLPSGTGWSVIGFNVDVMTGTEISTAAPRTATARHRRRRCVDTRAASQAGVLSRAQLYSFGLTRGEVRAEVRARRWQVLGRHCILVHNGPVTDDARHWTAVLEGGPRAHLDGESALTAAGLKGYDVRLIRVSVPRGARIRQRGSSLRVDIRQTRRWSADDLAPAGIPRARVAVAAIRAALWAVSDRQAALLLTMVVQQGLATAEQLTMEMLRVRRDKRRLLLHAVLLDLLGGVRSLGELDVRRGCRQRGLPEPDCQVLRRTRLGTYFLDFRWDRWAVVVEVDGIHHSCAQEVVGDALRQNRVALDGDVVLRLPLLGLRVCPDDFFDQIEEALAKAGCRPRDVMRGGCHGDQLG